MATPLTTRHPLDPHRILFGPSGRIHRPAFVLGVVLLVVLAIVADATLGVLDSNHWSHFWFGFVFYLTFLYMLTSVFVQRLHDMGRSAWVYTSWIVIIIMTLIGIMLAYGGADYFDAYSQFERKEAIDPAINEALQSAYRAELAEASGMLTLILSLLISGFAFVLALVPGQKGENRYGPAPATR